MILAFEIMKHFWIELCKDKSLLIMKTLFCMMIARLNKSFNTEIKKPCKNNLQSVVAISPDIDQCYVLNQGLVREDPRYFFEGKHIQTSFSPNIFTAQEAGTCTEIISEKCGNAFSLLRIPNTHYNS